MKTLLAPIDFSQATNAVLEEVSQLAKDLPADVILMHSTQPPIVTSDFGLAVENVQEITSVMAKNAEQQLAHSLGFMQERDVKARIHHCNGSAVTCIVEQAKQENVDYFVMGSHGQTEIYDLLVGSTTHGVLKNAPCPVIITPPDRD